VLIARPPGEDTLMNEDPHIRELCGGAHE
jgi:hypothetical protein